MEIKTGDVIKWNNFKDRRHGEIKPRWFILLGTTTQFQTPIFLHLSTTTTQLHYFEKGGEREKHLYVKFHPNDSPFDEPCILDIDEGSYDFTYEYIIKNKKDIEIKEPLKHQKLREIYNKIIRSDHFNKKIILDIHHSLNMIGIEGLKKPK